MSNPKIVGQTATLKWESVYKTLVIYIQIGLIFKWEKINFWSKYTFVHKLFHLYTGEGIVGTDNGLLGSRFVHVHTICSRFF